MPGEPLLLPRPPLPPRTAVTTATARPAFRSRLPARRLGDDHCRVGRPDRPAPPKPRAPPMASPAPAPPVES